MFEIFMIETTCLWFLYTVTLPNSVPGGWIKKQHKRCWLTVAALPDGHLEVPYSLLCTFVYTLMCPFPASLPLSPKNVFFKKLDQLTNIILFQSIRGDNERNQMLTKRNSGDWTKETRREAICTGEVIAAVVPSSSAQARQSRNAFAILWPFKIIQLIFSVVSVRQSIARL